MGIVMLLWAIACDDGASVPSNQLEDGAEKVQQDVRPGDQPEFGVLEPPEGYPSGHMSRATLNAAAPDFRLQKLGGAALRLSDLRGQPVVVTFWATWCPPCRSQVADLQEAFERYQAEGLVVVGVDIQEPAGTVEDFLEERGVTFPIVLDRDMDVMRFYEHSGVPTIWFLDQEGIVRDFNIGRMSDTDLEVKLAKIMPNSPP
jgi:peroxiredoxin